MQLMKNWTSFYLCSFVRCNRCGWDFNIQVGGRQCTLQDARWFQSVPLNIWRPFFELEDKKERYADEPRPDAPEQTERNPAYPQWDFLLLKYGRRWRLRRGRNLRRQRGKVSNQLGATPYKNFLPDAPLTKIQLNLTVTSLQTAFFCFNLILTLVRIQLEPLTSIQRQRMAE